MSETHDPSITRLVMARLEAVLADNFADDNGRTHFEECWRAHAPCAIRKALDLLAARAAEATQHQQALERLTRQAQDVSVTLGGAGCRAMPIVDGVRWLVSHNLQLRARLAAVEAERDHLKAALQEISKELSCERPCGPCQPDCETCGAHRGGYWCAGCVARAALSGEGTKP